MILRVTISPILHHHHHRHHYYHHHHHYHHHYITIISPEPYHQSSTRSLWFSSSVSLAPSATAWRSPWCWWSLGIWSMAWAPVRCRLRGRNSGFKRLKQGKMGWKPWKKPWENHGKIKKHQDLLTFVGEVARKSGFDVSKMGVTWQNLGNSIRLEWTCLSYVLPRRACWQVSQFYCVMMFERI